MAEILKYPIGIQTFSKIREGGFIYVDKTKYIREIAEYPGYYFLSRQGDRFMDLLKTFLEGNPFSNTELAKRERYFKNNIYIVLRALGFLPRVEEETCRSRMDLMLQTRRFIYIFELKTDGSLFSAINQIEAKSYAEPYLHSGKTIVTIAANYSSSTNNIDTWQTKLLTP